MNTFSRRGGRFYRNHKRLVSYKYGATVECMRGFTVPLNRTTMSWDTTNCLRCLVKRADDE